MRIKILKFCVNGRWVGVGDKILSDPEYDLDLICFEISQSFKVRGVRALYFLDIKDGRIYPYSMIYNLRDSWVPLSNGLENIELGRRVLGLL